MGPPHSATHSTGLKHSGMSQVGAAFTAESGALPPLALPSGGSAEQAPATRSNASARARVVEITQSQGSCGGVRTREAYHDREAVHALVQVRRRGYRLCVGGE